MELTLPGLPSVSGKDLNWMFWSQACTPSQNQRRQPCVLVSQFLKHLRLPYNSLVHHHQQVHCKSLLWQYTTSICQISGTEGKEEESDTDLRNVLGSSSYTKPVFTASKQSQHFPVCIAEHAPGLGAAEGFGTLLSIS